jgi:protocatechuate 4,5-dioxygenase beta chain
MAADFDPALSMELTLDHGVLVPMELAGIARDIPVVPVLFNCVQPPLPSMRRCYAFGVALGHALRAYPGLDRVAVIATGGLSHDLATPRMGMVNEAFDREFLRLLELGDVDALLQFSTNHVHEAGNGAEEIRMWITAMGIAGAGRYETHFYRAVPNWFTGIGIGEWKL